MRRQKRNRARNARRRRRRKTARAGKTSAGGVGVGGVGVKSAVGGVQGLVAQGCNKIPCPSNVVKRTNEGVVSDRVESDETGKKENKNKMGTKGTQKRHAGARRAYSRVLRRCRRRKARRERAAAVLWDRFRKTSSNSVSAGIQEPGPTQGVEAAGCAEQWRTIHTTTLQRDLPAHVSYVDYGNSNCLASAVASTSGSQTGELRSHADGILFLVSVFVQGHSLTALIDSGATRCYITPDVVLQCGLPTEHVVSSLQLATGERVLSDGVCKNV